MEIDKESLKKERDGIVELIGKLREPYNARLKEIDNLLWEEELKEAKANVGKCFIYRNNCYSCLQKQSDYWDVYYKISGFHRAIDDNDFDGYITTRCQKDSFGSITIAQERDGVSYPRFEDYEEITPEEFDEAYRKLLAELEGK